MFTIFLRYGIKIIDTEFYKSQKLKSRLLLEIFFAKNLTQYFRKFFTDCIIFFKTGTPQKQQVKNQKMLTLTCPKFMNR